MAIELKHSVIHGFNKEAGQREAFPIKKERLLDNNLPAVFSLVEGMVNLFGKRESRQVWGRFAHDHREGPFPLQFSGYAAGESEAAEFLTLSGVVVDEIARMASLQQAATGGHILCAHYETEAEQPRFIVAMIKERSGLQLNNDFVPQNVTEIDMSKLHQAALICVDQFLEIEATGHQDEPEAIDYLSFVAKATDGLSEYFRSALGCAVGVSSGAATNRLYAGVDSVFSESEALRGYRRRAKESLTEYLRQQLLANAQVMLNCIEN